MWEFHPDEMSDPLQRTDEMQVHANGRSRSNGPGRFPGRRDEDRGGRNRPPRFGIPGPVSDGAYELPKLADDSFWGLGYLPDRPDNRDYGMDALKGKASGPILKQYAKNRQAVELVPDVPDEMDLRKEGRFGDVNKQGPVQSCTAHAVTSMAEFHINRERTLPVELSRLFLYKISRELYGVEGDVGCTLRETLKALGKYGCLQEGRWPYELPWLEELPRIADLREAEAFRALSYCRLDQYNESGEQTLMDVIHALADGLPVAFGFSVLSSIDLMAPKDSVIPGPDKTSRVLGGHAVLAVGYRIRRDSTQAGLQGELLIRNSWGPEWGEEGYGYLPFEYVTRQLACDFWTIYSNRGGRTKSRAKKKPGPVAKVAAKKAVLKKKTAAKS